MNYVVTVHEVARWFEQGVAGNFQNWFIIPMKCCSSEILLGGGMLVTADISSGSGCMLDWSISWPKNLMDGCLNWYLSWLRVAPATWMQLSTLSSCKSCSAMSYPNTRTTSIWQRTPVRPLRILCIHFWNALEHLKCWKVVNWSSICYYEWGKLLVIVKRNPVVLAKSLSWHLAYWRLWHLTAVQGYLLFGEGNGPHIAHMCSKVLLILMEPFFFGTPTIPAHHLVG